MSTAHGHGHAQVGGHGHGHGHANEQPHGQGHGHGQGHQPPHQRPEAPTTAGRLIRYARVYDLIVWAMSLGWGRTLRKLPLDIAGIRRGERVLDVGCGTGDLTLAAAKRVGPGGMVYGIDASPEMIEVARRKAGRKGYAVQFQLEAVESLSFPDGSFDVVLSSLMMHHLPGDLQRRALAEIRRVLRPGGRILIVDWDWQAATKPPRLWEPGGIAANRHGQHTHTTHAPKGKPQPAGASLGALLRNADFTSVENGPLRYDWLSYALGRLPE